MLAVSQSIVHHGALSVAPQSGVMGCGGHYFAKYGIGLSLLAVPFVAFGDLVSVIAGNQVRLESFFAAPLVPLIMVVLAASLFRTTRRLGAGFRWATVIAVGSAFGTYALPYGKDFFAEPLTTLAIVLSIEFLINGRFELVGVALAAAVTTRPESVVLVAILPLIVWAFRGFRKAFVYGAIASGAVVDAVYNQYRFGSVLKTGYGSEGFSTPFLHGAAGLLFSPEKSVLLFAPIVILVGLGSIRLWKAGDRFVVVLTLTNLLVFFVLSATWHSWQGGWSWGPRLLLPGLIPTMLLLSPTDQEGTSCGHRPPGHRIRGVRVDDPGVHQGSAARSPSALRRAQHPTSVSARAHCDPIYRRPPSESSYSGGFRADICRFGKSTSDSSAPRDYWWVSPDHWSCWLRW